MQYLIINQNSNVRWRFRNFLRFGNAFYAIYFWIFDRFSSLKNDFVPSNDDKYCLAWLIWKKICTFLSVLFPKVNVISQMICLYMQVYNSTETFLLTCLFCAPNLHVHMLTHTIKWLYYMGFTKLIKSTESCLWFIRFFSLPNMYLRWTQVTLH